MTQRLLSLVSAIDRFSNKSTDQLTETAGGGGSGASGLQRGWPGSVASPEGRGCCRSVVGSLPGAGVGALGAGRLVTDSVLVLVNIGVMLHS